MGALTPSLASWSCGQLSEFLHIFVPSFIETYVQSLTENPEVDVHLIFDYIYLLMFVSVVFAYSDKESWFLFLFIFISSFKQQL